MEKLLVINNPFLELFYLRGTHGHVAHEFIIDTRAFDDVHIGCVDIAKRLQVSRVINAFAH